jgi:cephalosporin hydroxylase
VSVTELYEQYRADTALDIYEHLPRFVDAALYTEAQTVIELGVRGGCSTVAWLHAMEQTGGHLWSVDIDPAPPELVSDRWTFTQGDDLDPAVLAVQPQRADLLFIDTSHAFRQTLLELTLYGKRVRPGGLILCHDTELEWPFADFPELHALNPEQYPVRLAIEQYCAVARTSWREVAGCFGLGVIDVL